MDDAPHTPSPEDVLPALDAEEIRRYGRHLVLPQVGMEGQRRLKAARVLVVGAGGLGSPLALSLTAAGVGTLGIVEFDRVDLSNLQRQLLHGTGDVGRPKLDSALETLRRVNPRVRVVRHDLRLDASSAMEVLAGYDVVADGSDNFSTRYVVNDACHLLGKPLVFGAVHQFEGQVTVFGHGDGPCYRCLYPQPPPPGAVPSCAEAGVLGVVPGVIGMLQSNEVLKLLLGVGEPLSSRLLVFDGLGGRFREVKLRRDPDCPLCGDRPTITAPADLEIACEDLPDASAAEQPVRMSVAELDRRRREGTAPRLLDVRLPQELRIAALEGALHIPLHLLPLRLGELDRHEEIAVFCHVGVRSWQAVQFLKSQGFSRCRNLEGGIDAWAREIEPRMPRY